MSYWDVDPSDIDPETGRPYSNYSSPSLDSSFHDHEMDTEDDDVEPSRQPITDMIEKTFCFQRPRDDAEAAEYGWSNGKDDCLLIRNLETGEIVGSVASGDMFDANGNHFVEND